MWFHPCSGATNSALPNAISAYGSPEKRRGLCIESECAPERECLSNTRVILCLDDDVAALALRCLVLSSAGYEVLTAADGTAALELFRRIPIDLVITDYWLPGLTGTEVAAEMKQLKPAIPIVLFSGLVEAPPGSGHTDLVITKGMPALELLREVGKLLP
jgi:CheY-like chemotaxis protein